MSSPGGLKAKLNQICGIRGNRGGKSSVNRRAMSSPGGLKAKLIQICGIKGNRGGRIEREQKGDE